MGSKIGLILSVFFLFIVFLFGADLICIQLNYASMDSMTTLISYNISKKGTITDSLKTYVKNNIGADLYSASSEDKIYQTGDSFEYYLKKNYEPLVISESMELTIKRYAVIKIYN